MRHHFQRKNKAFKHYTRDVVCLPLSAGSTVRIPRGVTRANLAQSGFIGKISFTSEWSEAQFREEITAIFRRTFGLSIGQSFPFEFLSTVKGCKRLMRPNVSSSFQWGGKEVASISSVSCIYIMATIHKPAQVNNSYDGTETTFSVLEANIMCCLYVINTFFVG